MDVLGLLGLRSLPSDMPWATVPVSLFSPALSVPFALDDPTTDTLRQQRIVVPVLRDWELGVL